MSEASLGYIAQVFPKLSETFILNEVLGLERLGQELKFFSLTVPDDVPHANFKLLKAEVENLIGNSPLAQSKVPRWRTRYAERPPRGLAPERWARTREYVNAAGIRERYFVDAVFVAYALKRSGITHLHAHFANTPTLVALLANMLTGIPYSFSCHARDIYLTPPEELAERINRATFVTTCTGANRAFLAPLVDEATAQKIHLVYHGVDISKFAPGEQRSRTEQEPLRILSVGRLVEKKGFPQLLQACATLRAKGLNFECEIIGEGRERPLLEDQIAALGLGDIVTMPGARSQEQVLEAYRNSDIFCLPSQVLDNGDRDGIPNVLLEAMSVGMPVVSTAISGMPELVTTGKNGFLVPERDAQSIADALEALILDPVLRARVGQAARQAVSVEFDSSRHIHRMAELFRGVLR